MAGKLQELQQQARTGKLAAPSKITVATWLADWLRKVETSRRTNTHDVYSSIVERYLKRIGSGTAVDPGTAITQIFTHYEAVDDFINQLAQDLGILPANIPLSQTARNSKFWILARRSENISIVNNNFAPRFSMSWDPWSNNKTRFAVTAGRYYDKLFLNIPLIELEPATANLVFNSEPMGEGAFQVTGLRASVNPTVNISAVDRDLRDLSEVSPTRPA